MTNKDGTNGKATIREVYQLLQDVREDIGGQIKDGEKTLWEEVRATRKIAEENQETIRYIKAWAAGAGAVFGVVASVVWNFFK